MKFFKKVLIHIPVLKSLVLKNYYATGLGILFLNLISKYVLFINNRGAHILFNFTSRVNSPQNIKIGEGADAKDVYRCFASAGSCYYQAINGIEIGQGTIWAYCCHFVSANHSYKDLKKHVKGEPIKIGQYVWLASNTVILPQVNLGDYCIVGAGSVVTKSFPSHHIIAGNPAKALAKRCKKCLDKISLDLEYCSECTADRLIETKKI